MIKNLISNQSPGLGWTGELSPNIEKQRGFFFFFFLNIFFFNEFFEKSDFLRFFLGFRIFLDQFWIFIILGFSMFLFYFMDSFQRDQDYEEEQRQGFNRRTRCSFTKFS